MLGLFFIKFFVLLILRTVDGILTKNLAIKAIIGQLYELFFKPVDTTFVLFVDQIIDGFRLPSVRRTVLFIAVYGYYVSFL